MKPLISIVIPAYNVADYISECIKSIISQTFTDYEVIIVNDGSSDNTLDEINKSINDKFRVINQKNLGAGIARNTGINNSCGEYITFMDADDKFYNNHCLEKIANNLNKCSCDVLTYKMVRYYSKSKKYVEESDITEEDKIYHNIDDYLNETIKSSRLSVSPCDKTIKASIIKNNNILFDSLAMLEDIDWSLRLYEKVKSVMIINEPIYVYRKQRVNSTTYSYNKNKINACCDFLKRWINYNGKCKNIYIHYISYQYLILVSVINRKNSTKIIRKNLEKYKFLLDYDINFKVKKARRVYRIFGYTIMRIFLKLYLFIKDKYCIIMD